MGKSPTRKVKIIVKLNICDVKQQRINLTINRIFVKISIKECRLVILGLRVPITQIKTTL